MSPCPGYRVIFTTRSKVVARAEDWLGGVGGGSSSGAKATMEVVLGNVDFATLQSIADAAYADFIDELKSSGIEVVPLETITASAAFQKMKITGSTADEAVHEEVARREDRLPRRLARRHPALVHELGRRRQRPGDEPDQHPRHHGHVARSSTR